MKRFLVLPWAALAAAAPIAPAGAVDLDLDRAVETALRQNPGLAAVEETRAQVEGGITEARADAFPQIALVSSWSDSRSPSLLNSPDFEDFVGQIPGGFEPSSQELYRAVVEVSQPLLTFGKVGAAIDLAVLVADAADRQIATARLDTALAAADAYFRVLAAREGLVTVESEREFRQRDLDRIESLLEIGEATELERLRALSSLAVVEPEVERRRGQVAVAETRLRQILGLPPGEPLVLADDRRDLPEPPQAERLFELAFAERPELADLRFQEQARERQKAVTRAEGLPQVDLTGSYGREVRLLDNFDDPLYSAWNVAVGLRWEFFDGGRRKGQIAQIESQRQQLALQRADLEARIRLEIDQALSDYRTARARADSAETAATAAREAERVSRESYEQGVATQTDLLDAQSQAIASAVIAVESFYEARIQAARLIRAIGRIPNSSWAPSPETSEP
ncbi:MAG TPA: TolC family protein [Thermoanaerobaculia bacterium]|nr:TolC family protein [Thermoanaerobaculia bacterium]